jgi:hypothetical protein
MALLTHATELALKAFVLHAVESGSHAAPTKPPANHDLESWYQTAVDFGLPNDEGLAERIAALNGVHAPHFARYPQAQKHPIPDPAIVPDEVVEHLMTVCLPVVFPR